MKTDIGLDEKNNDCLMSAEALLAGTLALMTAHARCTCPQAISNKEAMTKKIIANLLQLRSHDHLTEQFRMIMNNLHSLWATIDVAQLAAESTQPRSSSAATFHHVAPTALQ
jgi:hypothetical protein